MLRLDSVKMAQGTFSLTADIDFPHPGVTAIIGPSGAGKSTLLATVGGFLLPERGRILWNGSDITSHTPGKRPIATLFQDNNLFPHLTVAQNIGLGLSPSLSLSAKEQERISSVLDEVGLTGLETRKPAALSGGQQSRVALARALARDKPIVLLDEPFAALGPGLRGEMLDLVARTLHGTVLMITHEPEDARRIAQRSVLVADGKVYPPEDTQTLLSDPPPALRAYLGSHPIK